MEYYARYMDRQRVSDTGMKRLVGLNAEGAEKRRKKPWKTPQWVKYTATAASLFVVVGLLAFALWRNAPGGTNPPVATALPPQPLASVSPTPTATPKPTGKLEYAELTEPSVRGLAIWEGETTRELTAEELRSVFPAITEALDYQWRGDALFHEDGTLRLLTVEGNKRDGTANVTITAGREEDAFLVNSEVKDGKTSYVGIDNAGWATGVDLLRGYYRNVSDYDWWYGGETLDNAWIVSCQCKVTGSDLAIEYSTCVKNGSLEENLAFNEQWTNTGLTKGIWMHTGTIDGKEVWDLPGVDPVAGWDTLPGTYDMELEDEGEPGRAPVMVIDDNGITMYSETLNFHTCDCDGALEHHRGNTQLRTICSKCKSIYSFDIVDENTLRFVAENSGYHNHHSDWTMLLTDGAVFRRRLDEVSKMTDRINAAEAELAEDILQMKWTVDLESTGGGDYRVTTRPDGTEWAWGEHHSEEHHQESHH